MTRVSDEDLAILRETVALGVRLINEQAAWFYEQEEWADAMEWSAPDDDWRPDEPV